ncbi:AraC family transcriptional regulator ligand-binding domain-containing protein [Nocardia sp. NPDC050712]|uniref:AraC family transcriptional regulator n=1 Tax=Nocardia sp. NPDC050712 TaxID=3155518 RepID=UPI0033EB9065
MLPSDATATLPIARMRALTELARVRGWTVPDHLTGAGTTPVRSPAGDLVLTWAQAGELVRHLWRTTDDELLGLGPGPVPRGTFRMICFGLGSAPDLRSALRRFESFERSLPGFPPIRLTETADEARLTFDISGVAQPMGTMTDALLAMTYRFLGWTVGERIRLRRLEVPHPRDPEFDDYDAVFGAPVRFSASAPVLVFDAQQLDLPPVRTEDELLAFLRSAPAGIIGVRDYSVSLAAQVRRILEYGRADGRPRVADIARELLMSPQTLRRRLHEELTSPREIREQILRDAAVASLLRGEETVAALSRRLGFSEPSAFSRAFRRWTGSSPGSYQRRRPGPDPKT